MEVLYQLSYPGGTINFSGVAERGRAARRPAAKAKTTQGSGKLPRALRFCVSGGLAAHREGGTIPIGR
jgi:hypothetical protein